MSRPLYIPPKDRVKGLTTICYQCGGKTVLETCKATGTHLKKCKYGDRHAYKAIISVPGSDNARKTKTLSTRDLKEARKQVLEFEFNIKNQKKQTKEYIHQVKPIEIVNDNIPRLVIHAMARYIGYLNNENVPIHLQKARTSNHKNDVSRAFEEFILCLNEAKIDTDTLSMEGITDMMVGELIKQYNQKQFGGRTVNKRISHFVTFLNWYKDEYNVPIRNRFERVQTRAVHSNIQTITKENFERLLQVITPENGIKKYDSRIKPERNWFRPWLKLAFKISIYSGRRRNEIANLKYSDVIKDENGVPSLIRSEDIKVNAIRHFAAKEQKRYLFIPITKDLLNVLEEAGYAKNRQADAYIIAPEMHNRHVVAEIMSQAFAHYYSLVEPHNRLHYGALRKTYISSLTAYLGENAKIITHNSSSDVVSKYYLDRQLIAKSARGFELFSDVTQRQRHLADLRSASTGREQLSPDFK